MPSIGDIVDYRLSETDVATIAEQREEGSHQPVEAPEQVGDVRQARLRRLYATGGGGLAATLIVYLTPDGLDTYNALARPQGTLPGTWAVPEPPPEAPSA